MALGPFGLNVGKVVIDSLMLVMSQSLFLFFLLLLVQG